MTQPILDGAMFGTPQQEQAILDLEELVAGFAGELSTRLDAANNAGVSQAILLPRLLRAFKDSFGDMPLPMGFPQ